MDISEIIRMITGGMDPNAAVMNAQGAMPPSGPPPQQSQPAPSAPQGVQTPVTNPQPASAAPTITQSPPDLANMYIKLMQQNQNAQQLDSGMALIAAGLTRRPETRQALIQSSAGGGGRGGMSLSGGDIVNMQKAQQEAQNAAIRRGALPALMKQYGWTPAQAQALEAGGKLDEVLQHYATENLGITENAETGQKTLFSQRTGKQIATIGGEKKPATQLATGPKGPQVINMETGAPVGDPLGPTDANVDSKGTKFPSLDTGFDYQRDEAGLVKLVDGKPKVDVITGTPAEQKLVDAQQKKVEAKMQAAGALSSVGTAIKATETALDEAIVPGAVGVGSKLYNMTVGQLGGMAGNVIRDNIDTIKANATFDKLAAMRQASPTGGALGSISDFENKLLGAATATLSPNLRADQLKENMYRVQATMELLANKKYEPGSENTFDADVKKRVEALKAERSNKTSGVTVRRREQLQ